LARQESSERVVKGAYKEIEAIRIGKNAHLARVGTALLLSNKEEALKRGINLHLAGEKKSLSTVEAVAGAARLLPPDPLLNAWVNMEPAQASQQGKALYKTPRDNFPLTILFGSSLGVLGRTPFVCAGVHAQKDGFLTTIRAPRGREGMGSDRLLHR
jgi:hypothetical protein